MAFCYEIYPHDRLVVMVGTGEVSGHEVIEEVRRFYADPKLEPGCRIVCDLRGVTTVTMGLEEVKSVVQLDRAFSRLAYSRLAIVTTRWEVVMLAQLYIAMQRARGCSDRIRLFEELDPALEWLEVSGIPRRNTSLTSEI